MARCVGRCVGRCLGGAGGVTLVSHPVNAEPGLLAFRDRELVGVLHLKLRAGVVCDIHAIADPAKLALMDMQFSDHTS